MLEIVDDGLGEVPVMRVHLEGRVSMEESERFFATMAARNERDDLPKVYMIWDSTNAKMPTMEVLKRWAAWSNDNKDMTAKRCHALVHVIPNAAVRGALKFTTKLAPMPCPVYVTRSVDEADALVGQELVERGLIDASTRDRWLASA